MALVNSKNISKLWCSILLVSSFLNAQNHQLNSMQCGFTMHGSEKQCGVVLHSEDHQLNGRTQERTSYQAKTQSSDTEVSSYLKPYGVDSWVINKSTNSSIIIETFPASVGAASQSNVLYYAYVSVKMPDGSYLVENHENHTPSESFYTIPADSPNGEYKIEVGVYKNDTGGYSLKCLSNDEYLTILEDTSLPAYTETHDFNDTAANEWTNTKSESFSVGNDVHEWNLNLLEGENLTIDLYNVEPYLCKFGPNQTFWDALDTKLYLLDANDNLIMTNDDGGNNKNARIYYTVPSTGNYKVITTNYGKFKSSNWNYNLEYQADNWDLGTTGITYYNLKIESTSNLPFTFEAIDLSNPKAIKINAILLTNDETLELMPVSTTYVETLITDLNASYSELYDTENWPGFELAGISKFYNPDHAITGSPHTVLAEIGSGPVAKQNYLNLIITDIDKDQTGIVGTTYLYNNTTQSTGASIVLDDKAGSGVLIHEMAHVIGMNHIAGTWPPPKHSLNLQDTTMGYVTNYISRPENSYMSKWESYTIQYQPYLSLYLTSQPASLKTPSYGDLFSEGFRSWLITNEYIISEAPTTGYEGNDISTAADNEWADMETITTDAQAVFSAIASSENSENNHAAYAYANSGMSKLYYGSRQTDNSWSQSVYETSVNSHKVDMNDRGDAIIIIEPWYSNNLKAIYKNYNDNEWSSPQIIGNSEKFATRPNTVINDAGDVAVVWLEINNNNDRIIKFNERVDGTWVGEINISDSAQIKELPSIDYNNNNDVIISWQEWDIDDSGRFDVVGKFRNGSDASFSNLETYTDLSNHSGFSQVAINDNGDVIVYWRQASGAFVSDQTQSAIGVLKARYRNLDGSLESTVDLSPPGEDSLNASTELTAPRVVFKGENAAVTWWGVNENHNIIYASIMVDKTTWNSTALTTPGKSADLSSIAMDDKGTIAVVWQRTDGLHQRIQSKLYNPTIASWSAVMTLSTLGVNAIHPDISVDGNGGATAAWTEWNSASGRYLPMIKKYSPPTWTGAVDNNYNNPANWSSNTVPTANNDIIIPPGASIDISGDLNVNSMSITDGASLISDGTITGLISYTRTIPTTNWYLISSPVVGQDKDAFVTASNLATGTGNNVGFADYDNSTKAWSYYQSGASGTGNFDLGEGHAVKLNTAGNVVFTGAFNDADARFTLSYNTNGFNLIGNPYLASVSVKEMLEEVNIETLLSEKTVWLLDEASASYIEKNLANDLEIAPGQAFFVSAAQTGDFSINESMQSHSSDTLPIPTTRPEVALTLSKGELSRTASVFYIDGATTGFDNGYDSSIFGGFANEFSIFTQVVANGSGRNLGTQSLPDNNFENMIVPVGVIAESGSALEFSARLENLPEDIKVFLEDKEEKTFTRLDALNASYKITTTSIINGVGRFYLHTAKSVLSTADATLDNVSIFKVHNSLRIIGLKQGKASVKLFNVLGKQVLNSAFESNGMKDISLPRLAKGIYIVQLETVEGKLNKKIILE
jgi:hypothetical protein